MTDPAFILSWDTSLVGDEGVTAELVPFPGSGNVAGWKGLDLVTVPEHIYFEANLRTVRQVDYPDNDAGWPIMSQRMRDILLPHAPRCRSIPVTLLDDTVEADQRLDGDKPHTDTAIEGFAAMQILERTDVMDMGKSSFTPDEDAPGMARDVAKLVFKSVELPWVFRLATYPYPLFVSAAGREALEKNGIKGVKYFPIARIAFM